jgi:hypothetical protein
VTVGFVDIGGIVEKDDELGYWKSRSCLGTDTNMRRYWVSIPHLLINGSSTAI